MFFASGTGGQIVAIFPNDNLIIVNLSNTYQKDKLSSKETIKLFDLVLAAKIDKPIDNPKLITLKTNPIIPENLYQQKLDYSKYIGDFSIDDKNVSIIELNGDLIIKDYYMKLKLFPISPNRFFVEDIDKYLTIELDENGFVRKLNYD
jgi:hypothetical protein